MKLTPNKATRGPIQQDQAGTLGSRAAESQLSFPDPDFYVLADGSTGFVPAEEMSGTNAPIHPSTMDTEALKAKARLKALHRELKPYFKARGAELAKLAGLEGKAKRLERKLEKNQNTMRKLREAKREREVDGALYVLAQAEARGLERQVRELQEQVTETLGDIYALDEGVRAEREEAAALYESTPNAWNDEVGGKLRLGLSLGIPFVGGVSAMALKSWRKPCATTGFRQSDVDYGLSGGYLLPGIGVWAVAMANQGWKPGAGVCASLGEAGVSGGNDTMYGPKAKALSFSVPMVGSFTSIYDPSTKEALLNVKGSIPVVPLPGALVTVDVGVSGDFKQWQRPARFIYNALGMVEKASAWVKEKADSVPAIRYAPINLKRLRRSLEDIWMPSPYQEVSRVPRAAPAKA